MLSDNRLVLSMDVSQKIHMWRAEDGQTIRLYAGPTVMHTLTPNSTYCISGAGDNRLVYVEQVRCAFCNFESDFNGIRKYFRIIVQLR